MAMRALLFLVLVSGCAADDRIYASAKHDAGLMDLFDAHARELAMYGNESMTNLRQYPNDGNAPGANGVPISVSSDPAHPAAKTLFHLEAAWSLAQRKRSFVLIVEDMEYGYKEWVDSVVPKTLPLVTIFRRLGLPIVWTNWVRRYDDGHYGAVDRFYGPRGIREQLNPCYVYGPKATRTVEELAPQTADEYSRLIESLHLNKFADMDEQGREILNPMLRAWGVNTILLTGAWTDDCIAATAFDAVDRYGFDLVVTTDTMASATLLGDKATQVMCVAVAKCHTAKEVVEHLEAHPELIEPPADVLRGEVYKKHARPASQKNEL